MLFQREQKTAADFVMALEDYDSVTRHTVTVKYHQKSTSTSSSRFNINHLACVSLRRLE